MNAESAANNVQLLLAIVAAFAGAVAAVWKLLVPIVTKLAERHLTFVDTLEKSLLKQAEAQAAHELADEKRNAALVRQSDEHELADEKRHAMMMAKSEELAAKGRHDTRDAITSATAGVIVEVKESRDYLCERVDLGVDVLSRELRDKKDDET